MRAGQSEWRAAIDLGTRLGRIPEAAASEALRRVGETGEAASDQVATWISLPPSETEALCALACAMLGTEPTRVTPKSDSDAATMKIDPNATMRLAPEAAPPPGVPKRLGPYELIEELGHGGMGVVYRARHAKLGSLCAVKVLLSGEFASTEAIARFQREAAAVAKMGKHPNLVAVHDLGQEGGLVYYAMELVEGMSLRERMREGDVPFDESVVVVEKVARAVHFAHAHGVIHRDLKPENIMMRGDGEPQVMDFGLAREVGSEERLSVAGQIMGTLAYMAPEQARGDVEAMDARTDVYALGGVLYELLTGVPPHPGKTPAVLLPAILRGEIVPPRRHRPEVPRDLENVCMKALGFEPPRRYASAEAFADDLVRFRRGEPVTARPVGRVARLARRVRRHPLVSGLIAASALLVVVLLWRFAGPARVRLATQPPNARVEAVGRTLWGNGWVWPAGEFTIRVSAPGHDPREVNVDLAAGATRDLGTIALDVDHGFLTVDSDPPGASVWDGARETGARTPVERLELRNGEHLLALKLVDHEDATVPVTVRSGADSVVPKVNLRHDQGTLIFDGVPPGMSVLVREAGTGREVTRFSPPVTLDLDSGRYLLVAQANGCFRRDRFVEVRREQATRIFLPLEPRLRWTSDIGSEIRGRPSLADVDQDGLLDAIVVTSGTSDRIVALSGRDGRTLWVREGRNQWSRSAAVGDFDADGAMDCVVAGNDGAVSALRGRDGSRIWAVDVAFYSGDAPAVGDLDGDGGPDCVVGSRRKKVLAIRGRDGVVLWSVDLGEEVETSPALGELDGDGWLDCVVGTNEGALVALSGKDGRRLWTYSAGKRIGATPGLADLDGDGLVDCVAGSNDERFHAVSGKTGEGIWTFESGSYNKSTPAFADLDGVEGLECIVASWSDRVTALSGRDGRTLWEYEASDSIDSSPVLADLDGDGTLECAVGSMDQSLHVMSGKDGRALWKFSGGASFGTSAFGDLDGDRLPECVVASQNGKVYAIHGVGGRLLWTDASRRVSGEPPPSFGDFDGDGVPDCVLSSAADGVLVLSGSSGDVLWEQEETGGLLDSMAIGSLDGDGRPDIAGLGIGNTVHAMAGADGHALWKVQHPERGYLAPALADLNGDGTEDLVASFEGGEVRAQSGKDGRLLWSSRVHFEPWYCPILADVTGDGLADVLVPTESSVEAFDGGDGRELWQCASGDQMRPPLVADFDGDGDPDCVVSGGMGWLEAVEGRDGSVLWERLPRSSIAGTPVAADVDRDGGLDVLMIETQWLEAIHGPSGTPIWSHAVPWCAADTTQPAPLLWRIGDDSYVGIPSEGGELHIVSALDGSEVRTLQFGTAREISTGLADLDSDGSLDLVVCGWERGREAQSVVCALSLARPGPFAEADPVLSLARARHAAAWTLLDRRAEEALRDRRDPGIRAVAWRALGVARLWGGRAKEALGALREARMLGLRGPDLAVHAWLAATQWKECTPAERTEMDDVLLEAFAADPDGAFDAVVQTRRLFSGGAVGSFRTRIKRMLAMEGARELAALLSVLKDSEGGPLFPREGDVSDEVLDEVRARIASRLGSDPSRLARGLGYLALLADGREEEGAFDLAYASYRIQPMRPRGLDLVLEEVSYHR